MCSGHKQITLEVYKNKQETNERVVCYKEREGDVLLPSLQCSFDNEHRRDIFLYILPLLTHWGKNWSLVQLKAKAAARWTISLFWGFCKKSPSDSLQLD